MKIEPGTQVTPGGQKFLTGNGSVQDPSPRDCAALGEKRDVSRATMSLAQALRATANSPTSAELAKTILSTPAITLDSTLPSGHPPEGADALSNIKDTADGKPAHRSDYGTAPGGTVHLDERMLNGMLRLNDEYGYNIEISTIAGGSHSKHSYHYAGTAFDIMAINGVEVSKDDGLHDKVMAALKKLGAIEILGPGHAGHDHHIHTAWPNPSSDDAKPPDSGQDNEGQDGDGIH
jgi:hypothetical protein